MNKKSSSAQRHHPQCLFYYFPWSPKGWTLSPEILRHLLGWLSVLNCTDAWAYAHNHLSAVQSLFKKNEGLSPWLLQKEACSWCPSPAATALGPVVCAGPARGQSSSAPLLTSQSSCSCAAFCRLYLGPERSLGHRGATMWAPRFGPP